MQKAAPFGVPPEIDEILELLPPRVALNVPEAVLAEWFHPVASDGGVDEAVLKRAEVCTRTCGCRFAYDASLGEGDFYRYV